MLSRLCAATQHAELTSARCCALFRSYSPPCHLPRLPILASVAISLLLLFFSLSNRFYAISAVALWLLLTHYIDIALMLNLALVADAHCPNKLL